MAQQYYCVPLISSAHPDWEAMVKALGTPCPDDLKEASQVLYETDLTPRQLLEQRDELRDLICSAKTFDVAQTVGEQAVQLLDYLRGAVSDIQARAALAKVGGV